MTEPVFAFSPIAHVRSPYAHRIDAPHRPNPIGLSCVQLDAIDGRVLHVRGLDLLDGTPVLDIKPYVPYADAFPEARAGWIDAIDLSQGVQSAPGPRRPRQS